MNHIGNVEEKDLYRQGFLSIYIDVTDRCNLTCNHCYAGCNQGSFEYKAVVPLTKKKLYKEIDFTRRNNDKIEIKILLEILSSGKINGIRLSNKTILSNGDCLEDTESYCMPLILPVREKKVKKGDFFLVNLAYKMCGGLKSLKYNIRKIEK